MQTWPIYIKLQTEMAYGPGASDPGSAAEAHAAYTRDYLDRTRTDRVVTGKGSLIVGPGGPNEILAMRPSLPGPIHVLTAHLPEVEAVKRGLEAAGITGVSVEAGDMHCLPYQSGHFELVFTNNVFEHCIAPYAALMECRRVTRHGGVGMFILPTFAGREGGRGPFHLHCLTREVWGELMRKTGWMLADVVEQKGGEDPDPAAGYIHFRCNAVEPPDPHNRVLQELVTYHATKR